MVVCVCMCECKDKGVMLCVEDRASKRSVYSRILPILPSLPPSPSSLFTEALLSLIWFSLLADA